MRFAARVAKDLSQKKGPIVIGLVGDLGAGKTVFAQSFLAALGVKERVTSPTFILMRPHALNLIKQSRSRCSPQLNYFKTHQPLNPSTHQPTHHHTAYHADLYRLDSHKELQALEFKKIISNPGHIVLVEWADKFKKAMPKNTIWIKIEHGAKKTERHVTIRK